MLKVSLVVALLAIGLFNGVPAACGSDSTQIKVGGVGSSLGTMRLLAAAFEKTHPGATVKVLPSLGSSGGIKAVQQGAIDIGLSGRQLQASEKGAGLLLREIAKTPFVFVTHANVRQSGITLAEIENIYRGRTSVWPDGSRIRLILRPAAESDSLLLMGISPGMDQAVRGALARPGMLTALTDQENLDIISKTPGGLGAVTLAQISTEQDKVKVLSLNGVKPSVQMLANGRYPLSKPLYLVTIPEKTSPLAQKFIDFILSSAGKKILADSGNLLADGKAGR